MPRARSKQRTIGPVVPPRARASRWPLVVVACATLALGGIVVERLTRPAADPLTALPPPVAGDRAPVPVDWPEPVRLEGEDVDREGRELADRLVTELPDVARAQTVSGRLCALFGAPAEALVRWEKSVAIDPAQAEAWLGLAELAHTEGDYPRVIDCLDRLAASDAPLARKQLAMRVESLVRMGEARRALDDLDALGDPAALPAWALVLRGEALVQLGDHARAADSYRLAVDDPQQASVARYGLARCLARLGRTEEAAREREAYARIEEANLRAFDEQQRKLEARVPDDSAKVRVLAGYHTEVGSLFAKRNRFDDAERHWRRACSLAPDMPEPRRFLESLARR
jgi:tetratricopeptide (TPR) repeat protein